MASTSSLSSDERGIIVSCSSCGRANRVPFARINSSEGRCAQCKAPLPALAQPVEVTSAAAFRALVSQSPLPVLIDFWAPWCGPCQMVAPEVARLASTAAGEFVVAKVNTEDLPDVGGALGIRSIPTFAVFSGGREMERMSGAMPAPQLRAFVQRAAGASGR